MAAVSIPIELPDSFVDEVADAITQKVMANVQSQLLVNELPPYPNRSEIMKILKVGYDRVDQWMADGLEPVKAFGTKVDRFDRDDIKKYINSKKSTSTQKND